jgi:hypothetical protein
MLAALLVLAVLTHANAQLPLISTERGALVALVVLGMAMCSGGAMSKVIGRHGWKHPITVIGVVLGVVIFAVFLAALTGVSLPLVASEREAFLAITLIAVMKVVITAVDSLMIRRA